MSPSIGSQRAEGKTGLAYRWFGLNEVVAFWFAYIITLPLGASVADWTGMVQTLRISSDAPYRT